MNRLTVIVFLIAVSNAIRVPNAWDVHNTKLGYQEIRQRRGDSSFNNRQHSVNLQPPPNVYLRPANTEWSPISPKKNVKIITSSSRPKYYKKQIARHTPKKYFHNILPPSNPQVLKNYKNPSSYTFFKNPTSIVFPSTSNVNNFHDVSPITNKQLLNPQNTIQIQNDVQQNDRPNFSNFDQLFDLLVKPTTEKSQTFFLPQRTEGSFLPKLPISQINNSPDNQLESVIVPQNYHSHLSKNYRDDKTHEPEANDPHYVKEEQQFEREEKAPVSSHEFPAEIPTKPIYPGEGLWAKPGLKHKPYISQQTYDELKEDKVKPDGYDTFESGEKVFDQTKGQFRENLEQFPSRHNFDSLTEQKQPSREEISSEREEEDSEEDDGDFVPTKLYAQVRASENKEHLPENEDDGRLKEAIKESKVHTVYTEEGYEDSAYDHAGHEKEAANDEGFEDLEREKLEKKEKRVPHNKSNLHLPKHTVEKYTKGEDLLTDKEIENLKKEILNLDDSDAAGTQVRELGNVDSAEIETDKNNTQDTTASNLPRKRSNNFVSTKETKTMTTKEKDDGNMETEISSDVKVILQPNKSQKYVKMYPKVYKTIYRKKQHPEVKNNDKNVNFSGIFIEEIIPTTQIPFTKLPLREFEDIQEEMPMTTLPTTAIPKPHREENLEALDSINNAFLNIDSKKRVKRFTNDFSNLRLEGKFLPPIKHDVEKIEEKPQTKFPYYVNYKREGINENSPLRYSEGLENIPKKTGQKMVFYEEADKKVICPEVESTVNPIPERVLKAEANKANDDDDMEEEHAKHKQLAEQPKTPRLSGLGNKIDCLKIRYFGEEPLDSPFFEEELVEPPKPIFGDLIAKNSDVNEQINEIANNIKRNKIKNYNEIFDDQVIDKNNKNRLKISDFFGDTTQNTSKISQNIENNEPKINLDVFQTNLSTPPSVDVINILTTPKYTVTLKPKHIYHQIELLEYLPASQAANDQSNVTESHEKMKRDAINEANPANESSDDSLTNLDGSGILKVNVSNGAPFLIFDVNKFLPNKENKETIQAATNATSLRQAKALEESEVTDDGPEELPEAEELVRRKKIRKKRPQFQIFDVNKFLPTTPRPIFDEIMTTSTILPKYKVHSEVFYKDDIKPNEQLHVFTDILNNIKNSSKQQQLDTSIESSEPISVTFQSKKGHINSKMFNNKSNTAPIYEDSYLKAYGDQEVDSNYYSQLTTPTASSSTTDAPDKPVIYKGKRKFYHRKSHHPKLAPVQSHSTISNREEQLKMYLALLEAKKQQQHTTTIMDYGYTIPVTENEEYVEKTTKVMGLLPPGVHRYKTIHHPKRDNSLQFANPGSKISRINKFFVLGLKPPPKQRIIVYSDFTNNNLLPVRRNILIRGKRSTGYSALSRNKESKGETLEKVTESTDSEDEDYVPHRSKNYYYDEKTGKIIYRTTEEPQKVDDEEEVEYEEIIYEPPSSTTSKPKQDPIFATATPPPDGESYIDFVKKLKKSPGYQLIPDPTTTEKTNEETSQKSTTTLKPESTTPPEFLNILAKVRQSNKYKAIEDKKETKTTTTEAPEEIANDEEDEDEYLDENIKNSGGGLTRDTYEQLGIFDVTDFIPKLKNYLPKTSYDSSKYKTISRPTSKPTPATDDTEELDEKVESKPSTITERPIRVKPDDNNLNEASLTAKTKKIPVVLQKSRLTTTTQTSITIASTERPTTKSLLQNRQRKPTTLRSTISSTTSVPTLSITEMVQADKLKRNYRRRPIRIKTEHTSPKFISEEDEDNNPKVLKRRSDTAESSTPKSQTFVEAFKNYHRNKKHGGAYKQIDKTTEQSKDVQKINQTIPEIPTVDKGVEVIAEYDKSKRHGGNYRKIEENENISNEEDVDKYIEGVTDDDFKMSEDKPLIIDLLSKHDEENVDESQENVSRSTLLKNRASSEKNNDKNKKPVLIKPLRSRIASNKLKKNPNRKVVVTEPTLSRLTDIVPKPESFYKDPSLPLSVNKLEGPEKISSDEISNIFSTESSSSEESIETIPEKHRKKTIVKDPSKRLYFYAPL